MIKSLIILITLSLSPFSFAVEKDAKVTEKDPTARNSKKISLETLLIEGQNQKGELDVITGNVGDDGDGLLKMKKNFLDQIAVDAGEKIR